MYSVVIVVQQQRCNECTFFSCTVVVFVCYSRWHFLSFSVIRTPLHCLLHPSTLPGDPALLPWYFNFMKGYISLQQFAKLQATVLFLMYFGASMPNMLLFWAGSGLVSAVRLFYFGTYTPHKPRKGANEVMAWAKARSASAPTLLSFLRCYCFDMHWVSALCSAKR